ncbi:MAG TPA: DUF1552 domain-containing protein [Polyangiaceae bacterium]|nr:DUF1552 domain-containing protein [Polyangiaceae bacterium]
MHYKNISRRTLIRGAAGAALALPFLELTAGKASAQAASRPKRLVIYFNGEGNVIDKWRPSVASGAALPAVLPPMLNAISSYKSKLNLLYPIDNVLPSMMAGNDHNKAGRSLLSCNVFTGGETSAAAGPSIDQYIKQKLALKSLELQVGDPSVGEYQMLFSGPGQAVTGEANPQRVYDRLFANLPAGGGAMAPAAPVVTAAERLALKRKDVMSAVRENFNTLRSQLGAEDRLRLDAHAARVQELEGQVGTSTTPGPIATAAKCGKPVLGTIDSHPARNKAQMLNAAMAMTCNLAQVVTIQDTLYDSQPFPWLGLTLPQRWHLCVHDRNPKEAIETAFAWYATAFKDLLDAMDSIDEGDGTLLDNSLVVWITEFGDGANHNPLGIPVVWAGKLGGALRTDRYFDFGAGKASTNQMFVTIMNLMGIAENTFGVGPRNSGTLPGIV